MRADGLELSATHQLTRLNAADITTLLPSATMLNTLVSGALEPGLPPFANVTACDSPIRRSLISKTVHSRLAIPTSLSPIHHSW